MYFGALAKLDGHPLQKWAEEQLSVEKAQLDERKKLSDKLEAALASANAATAKIVKIQNDLDAVQLKMNQANNKKDFDDLQKRATR